MYEIIHLAHYMYYYMTSSVAKRPPPPRSTQIGKKIKSDYSSKTQIV